MTQMYLEKVQNFEYFDLLMNYNNVCELKVKNNIILSVDDKYLKKIKFLISNTVKTIL